MIKINLEVFFFSENEFKYTKIAAVMSVKNNSGANEPDVTIKHSVNIFICEDGL